MTAGFRTAPTGVTELLLDASGKITRVTEMYDGRLLAPADKQRLVVLSMDK